MAAGTTMLSAEEYLANTYRPNCEYIDGALQQKKMAPRKHGLIQSWLAELIR